MNKKITCWYVKTKEGIEFNHIEDGHILADKPTPKRKIQEKMWNKTEWAKKYAELINGKVTNEN